MTNSIVPIVIASQASNNYARGCGKPLEQGDLRMFGIIVLIIIAWASILLYLFNEALNGWHGEWRCRIFGTLSFLWFILPFVLMIIYG